MEQTPEQRQISETVESYVAPLRKQITELLTEIEALKQASFISSKQDVIKSVCEYCGNDEVISRKKGKFCTECNRYQKQTVL